MKRVKKLFNTLEERAQKLKTEIAALYLASKRDDLGIVAKVITVVVIAYALSPIDLIPDFIPVLGYLDDVILLPLGIALVLKLIPKDVMAECRVEAELIFKDGKPKKWLPAIIIVLIWLSLGLWFFYKLLK